MRVWLVVAGALLCGCAQGGFEDGGPRGTEAGPQDAGTDAGRRRRDAGRDAGHDGGGLDDGGGDAGRRDAGPPMDSGPGMDAGRDAGPSLCTPSASNMEISEVMVASRTGAGDRGEWFELHNLTGCPIGLTDLVIDIGGTTHTVTSGLLTAGGFLVMAQSGDATENHGLGDDYVYGPTLRMGNSDGTLLLTYGAAEVALVAWGSTDHRPGRSRQLGVGNTMNSSLGDTSWCDSTAVYSMADADGGPYLGTPGMLNATCP